jgi:dTDP-4-dehydrorhamnose reductase
MKIAIVGAGGLVGSEFARHLSTHQDVLTFRHSDLEITDSEAVTRVILTERPSLIVNCAVLGVDASELDPSLAWSVNVSGAENLAKAAAAVDAEFVQFSSNYVFDGRQSRHSPYAIEDAATPINTYGQTKLAAEHAVSAAHQRCFIVRTSWVFGSGKENFFSTAHRRLRAAKVIRAISDVWANSTYVRDLVARVMEIVFLRRYATYHVVNSGLCSYYEFALEAARILRISAVDLRQLIAPIKLSDLRLAAERPHYTPLSCRVSEEIGLAPLRDWRLALAEYIRDGR